MYWLLRHPYDALSIMFHSDSPYNEAKWKVPKFNDLLVQSRSTADLAAQQKAFGSALTMLADNAGWSCPALGAALYVAKKGVSGVAYNSTDIVNFENVTIA